MSKVRLSRSQRTPSAGRRGPRLPLICLSALICLLAACSGGHGGSSGTGASPDLAIATSNGRDIPFPSCPTRSPAAPHPTTDADAATLARALVPIPATAVRVCQYAADQLLTASGFVRAADAVTRLVTATNHLTAGRPAAPACTDAVEPRFLVTFSDGSTDVDVIDAGDCGFVTNGKLLAVGAPSWRRQLADAGLTPVADHQIPLPTTPGRHETHGKFLTGALAGDGVCFWVEAPDHTRTSVVWPDGYTARLEPRRVIDFGYHVVGVVGQDVALGGTRGALSSALLRAVAPNVRSCLPPPDCHGDACSLWIAA